MIMPGFNVKQLPREFVVTRGTDKIRLEDPNPHVTPSQVMEFYSATYPELNNGSVSAPNVKATKVVYDLSVTVGKKG